MSLSGYLQLIKYNAKILNKINIAIGILYASLIPVIFNLKWLNAKEMAEINEFYISILGIILLTWITEIEFEEGVIEIISAKKISKSLIFLYRLLLVIVIMGILISILNIFAIYQGSVFNFKEMFIGSIVTGLFLGILGITFTNLSKNLIAGYLITFAYYIMEFSTKGKYTQELYLFSLTTERFTAKYNLIGIIVFMVIINLFVINKRNLSNT